MHFSRENIDARSMQTSVRSSGVYRPTRGGHFFRPEATPKDIARQVGLRAQNTLPVVVDTVLKDQKRGQVVYTNRENPGVVGLGVVLPARARDSRSAYYMEKK